MKKLTFCLMLLAGLMSSSAWAQSSNYYASLTTKVAATGGGKVYASKTDSTPSDDKYAESVGPVQSDSTSTSGGNVTLYAFAKAKDGYEFKGWAKSESGATSYESTNAKWGATLKAATSDKGVEAYTYYAYFGKKQLPSFSVTYLAPQNGSYKVDGTSVGSGGLTKGPYTEVYTPTLVADAADGYAFNGWYTTTDGGATKNYFSSALEATHDFTAAATVGADFVKSVTVTTADELLYSLEHDTLMEIPDGVTITIESGTLVNGKTLIVNGDLFLSGTFTNKGTIKGGGRITTYTKQVTQTGASGDTPFVTTCPSNTFNKAYYKTAIASLSGKISGTTPTCNIQNAAKVVRNGVTIAQCVWPSTVTPAILSCTINSSKAVNCITGFNNPCYYVNTTADIAKALLATKAAASKNNFMLALLADVTVSNDVVTFDSGLYDDSDPKYKKFTGNYGTIDLAGNTWTVSPKNFNSYSHTFLNGKLAITALMYGGTLNCFNLGLASSKSYLLTNQIRANANAVINIYDCTTDKVFASYNGSETPTGSINFYSSGETVYNVNNFASKTSAYHIYGGRWKTKPDDSFIASAMKSDYAFYQTSETDTSYSLKKNSDMSVVQLDDGTKYTSLADAFAALPSMTASSVTMTMLKDAKLASAVTVPPGKTVEMELKGMCITASNGFVVNNGTFRIGDGTGKYDTSGGRVIVEAGYLLQNAGEAEITYGYYTGNINLTGGKLITHHGYFAGTVTAANKSYADLRGGRFAKDVTALLADGYYQRSNYVGPFPKPAVSREWITSNGGYWRYSMKTLQQSDLDLYNNPSSTKGDYSLENWKRRAEVKSMVEPYLNYVVDIGVGFDRNIAKDTATARVTDPLGITQDLDKDVAANELYRVFSPYFVQQGTSQKRYSNFLAKGAWPEDFQTTTFGITTSTEGNYGTTADLRIDLCSGPDTSLTSVYALMSEYVALSAGKDNQAMIQPESGKATFYATIEEAVAACEEGGTIKLCNNITSNDTITISKAVKIDTNGMEFKGKFVAGDGYEMTTEEKVLDIEKYLGKKHCTYTFKLSFTLPEDEKATVTADPESPVTPNTEVTVTVTPNTGYFFVDGSSSKSFKVTITTAGQQVKIPDDMDIMIKKAYVPTDQKEITIALPTGDAPVKVTENLITKMKTLGVISSATPTAAEVSAGLNTTQANERTVWQNIVMGVDGTKKENEFATIGEKGKDEKGNEIIVVKTPIDAFALTGDMNVTVTYTLLMSNDGGESWSEEKTKTGLTKPEFDLGAGDLGTGDVLWKFKAVFKTSGGEELE